jgi:phosphoserine phosphatase
MIVFDVDGTLTPHISVWQYIHEMLNLWQGNAERYLERYLKGEIDYGEFCRLDAALWKGRTLGEIREIVSMIPYNPGVRRTLLKLKDMGFLLAAVSTGLTVLTDRIHRECGLYYSIANRLRHLNGVLTGDVEILVEGNGKGKVLDALAGHVCIPAARMICVGDSVGDIPMVRKCGFSISFRSTSRELDRLVDYTCRGESLEEIIAVIAHMRNARPGMSRKDPLQSN